VKDYGFMLREDRLYAEKARRIAALARDVTEVVETLGLSASSDVVTAQNRRVAYHSACSMQHGQVIHAGPKRLLAMAGFEPLDVPEGHLCCGSAGTYNILQPKIAEALRDRKLANIAATDPDLVATGNIGCITQLAAGSPVPIVHTVELLDWATGGPQPKALRSGHRERRPKYAENRSVSERAAKPINVSSIQPVPPARNRSPAAPSST